MVGKLPGGVSRVNPADFALNADMETVVEIGNLEGEDYDIPMRESTGNLIIHHLDELICVQKGMLKLLEAAFEDDLSSGIE